MKYAVIKTGGKQYKVSEGQVLSVERLTQKANENLSFEEVLLCVLDDKAYIGNPTVASAFVDAKVVEHKKGEKLHVSKFKSKVRYRRTTGHRQHLTDIKIEKIGTKDLPAGRQGKK